MLFFDPNVAEHSARFIMSRYTDQRAAILLAPYLPMLQLV
jgi:hypothetical protein